jgi:hypothetical protein
MNDALNGLMVIALGILAFGLAANAWIEYRLRRLAERREAESHHAGS